MSGEFVVTLQAPEDASPFSFAWTFDSVEAAYSDVCAAIPETAAALLRSRCDPFACAFLIHGSGGALLMEVPLTELLRPSAALRPEPVLAMSGRLASRLAAEAERLRHNIARARRLHERATVACDRSVDLHRNRSVFAPPEASR